MRALVSGNIGYIGPVLTRHLRRDGLSVMGFDHPTFRESDLVQLRTLEQHMSAGRLDEDLRWRGAT